MIASQIGFDGKVKMVIFLGHKTTSSYTWGQWELFKLCILLCNSYIFTHIVPVIVVELLFACPKGAFQMAQNKQPFHKLGLELFACFRVVILGTGS